MERTLSPRLVRFGPIMAWALVAACLWACALGPAAAHATTTVQPGGGVVQTFEYGAGASAFPYTVFTPKKYRRAHAPTPLVVFAHGCQTSAEQQMRSSLYNHVAARNGFVVLYPDVGEADAALPGPLRNCWSFFNPGSQHRDQGDAAAIAGMTREVMAKRRIDPQRVYLVGMSAGGFMTSILASAYPDLYAAVGVVAGGAYGDASCIAGNPLALPVETSAQLARDEMGARARIVPRIVIGGDADQGITPPCADKALAQGLRTDNLVLGPSQDGPIPLTPASSREVANPGGYGSTISSYLDPNGCLVGQRWLIHGMNHFWPGGSADPAWASWTDPKGPSGAQIAWNFLKRYTKDETSMPCAEAKAKR